MRLTIDLRESADSSVLAAACAGLPVVWEAGEGQRHKAEFSRLEVPGAEVIKRVVNACHVSELHIAEPAIEEVVAGKRHIADLVLPKSSSLGDLDPSQLQAALGLRTDELLTEQEELLVAQLEDGGPA